MTMKHGHGKLSRFLSSTKGQLSMACFSSSTDIYRCLEDGMIVLILYNPSGKMIQSYNWMMGFF